MDNARMNYMNDMEFKIRADALTARMSLDEKLDMLSTHQAEVKRLGIGEFYIGTEVARGYVGREKEKVSTVFPQPVGLASTFDAKLMEELGKIAGNEARAYYNEDKKGGLCLWGPTIDPVHDTRWGRTEEAYGEDAYLAGEFGRAYTKGMASDDGRYLKTVPTLKHFCGNTNEQDRGTDDAVCPLRLKHEYYYAPFRRAIMYGGARSMMASYNKVNGVPSACNRDLQTEAKDKWGAWFMVTDGGGFSQIHTSHHYTDSHSETIAEVLRAGCDVMTDSEALVRASAKKALDEGRITMEDIDRSVKNTLFARLKLGQFDTDHNFDKLDRSVIDCQKHRDMNLRATMEQVCLLKNDGILPVKNQPSKIAVVGALADENLMDWYTGYSSGDVSVLEGIKAEFEQSEVAFDSLWDIVAVKAQNGRYLSVKENGEVVADAETVGESELFELQNWGENWQNLFSVKYKRYIKLFDDNSIKLADRKIYAWFTRETFNLFSHGGKTLFEEFLHHRRLVCDNDGNLTVVPRRAVCDDMLFEVEVVSSGEQRGVELAKNSELVIYCVGNHPVQVAKECYDRKTLALNIQSGMALKLCEANPSTVMTIISSYPYSVSEENEKLSAILYTSHAGAFLGTAVAQTVSGKNNPSARLPLTWYASDNDLPDIKEYDIEKSGATYMYFKGRPLYPFGYGLSYSQFEYKKADVSRFDRGVLVGVLVKNNSLADGDEVVQVYYGVKNSAVSRPEKKLCGFARERIASGECRRVEVFVPYSALEIYNVRNGEMAVEQGEYVFYISANSEDVRLEKSISIDGSPLGKRGDAFSADSFETVQNARICYSKRHHASYVRAVGWGGEVSYGGVDTSSASKLTIRASSIFSKAKLIAKIGDFEKEIELAPSVSADDFADYTIDIPEVARLEDTTLTLRMQGEGISVERMLFQA